MNDFFAREFWRFVLVQQKVGELAETAIDYPPMQDPASFNLEAVKKQIEAAIQGTAWQLAADANGRRSAPAFLSTGPDLPALTQLTERLAVPLPCFALCVSRNSRRAGTDPLPSWNDGPRSRRSSASSRR